MQEWNTSRRTVELAISGDRGALRTIWAEHRRWVAAIILAHKSRDTDLDDLLQIVAAQLCRKVHEVRDPEAFRPWLRMVAVNTARADGRSVTRQRRGFLRLVGMGGSDAQQDDHHHRSGVTEEAARLMELARTLPEGYREPLLMRCVRGMSYRQIGAVLDLPETTIETRIARGRRMLRELASRDETKAQEPAAATS